jgi:hypothetical protein
MARLDTKQAAEYICCAKRTLDKWRVAGGGPVFIKLGRSVRYDTIDLDKWIAAQKRASTSDTAAPMRRRAR